MTLSRKFFLNRKKMIGFLNELEAATTTSLYIPIGLSLPEVEKVMEQQVISPELAEMVAGSKTESVLFWNPSHIYLVTPPFPIMENHFVKGCAIEPLRSMLKHDYRIALILVRLGAYAIGLCQGETLISSKVGTGLVHSRHKKGGSSQKRFQRHREKQIESFLNRVCSHTREIFEPQRRILDYLVYGGAKTTILSLQKHCSFLRQFEDRNLPPLLDIAEPRQAVLETAIGRVWLSSVTEWHDDSIHTKNIIG
jgi:hypothetical protein